MSLLRHHQLLMSAKSSGPATYYSTKLIARNSTATPRYAAYNVPEFTTASVGAALGTMSRYHPDSTHFATARYTETNTSGNCHVRNMSDDTSIFTVNPVGTTRTCMAIAENEVFVGAIGSPYAHRYRISDGAALPLVGSYGSAVFAAAYSPDGTKFAACGGGSGTPTRKAAVYDMSTGGILWEDSQDFANYYGVSWSPDGSKAAFAEFSYSQGCAIVDVSSGTHVVRQGGAQWYGVEWTADGAHIVLYGGNDLRVLDGSTYNLLPTLPEIGTGMISAASSADGRYLAINSTGTEQFRVYDLATWSRVTVSGGLPSGPSSVRSLIFDAVPV